jgi:hypothetical protein
MMGNDVANFTRGCDDVAGHNTTPSIAAAVFNDFVAAVIVDQRRRKVVMVLVGT